MKSTAEQPAKLIFTNTVNALVLETPIVEHARGLFAASPRKLWLAQPGDLDVMSHAPHRGDRRTLFISNRLMITGDTAAEPQEYCMLTRQKTP